MTQPETVRAKLSADIAAWAREWNRPVGASLFFRLVLLEPGFQLALLIRLQEALSKIPVLGRVLRRIVWYMAAILVGSDIDPHAEIGGGIYFPHPYGIVVHGTCKIGRNVWILQNVTLGRANTRTQQAPVVESGAQIYAGAVVLGPVTVGAGAVIGANSVVLTNVPPGQVAVGVPARIVSSA